MRIRPVLLSGGSGSRLWPASRSAYPKQLLALLGEETMVQTTARRLASTDLFAPLRVIGAAPHRFALAEQLTAAGARVEAILLEPIARNTAAATAIAALSVARAEGEDAVLALIPSDHAITDQAAFEAAMVQAGRAAAAGWLVTFGMRPDRPETGYGWIRAGAPLEDADGVFRVERFVEKPKREEAERLFASGDHHWNSGMFVFRADAMLAELRRFAPEILSAAEAALDAALVDLDFVRLDQQAFARAPSSPIDKAVMEKTARAAVAPARMGWSDVGSWSSLWELETKDVRGNAAIGDVVLLDADDNYVRAERGLATVLGVRDLAIVATDDAVLVAPKARAQDVKMVVERLSAAGRSEAVAHKRRYRPWGYRQAIEAGPGFEVALLKVWPERRLSYHRHLRRAEHWVVLAGEALVRREDGVERLAPSQSSFIPPGTAHRLANPGAEPLSVIEIRTGEYLGEDDIQRLEDDYGRVERP